MVRPTTREGSESFWGRFPQCRERTVGERRKRSGRRTSPGRKEIWRDWWTGVRCFFDHFQSHFWIERPCWLWSPAPVAPYACPRLPSAEKATFSAGRWFLSHIHFFASVNVGQNSIRECWSANRRTCPRCKQVKTQLKYFALTLTETDSGGCAQRCLGPVDEHDGLALPQQGLHRARLPQHDGGPHGDV